MRLVIRILFSVLADAVAGGGLGYLAGTYIPFLHPYKDAVMWLFISMGAATGLVMAFKKPKKVEEEHYYWGP